MSFEIKALNKKFPKKIKLNTIQFEFKFERIYFYAYKRLEIKIFLAIPTTILRSMLKLRH